MILAYLKKKYLIEVTIVELFDKNWWMFQKFEPVSNQIGNKISIIYNNQKQIWKYNKICVYLNNTQLQAVGILEVYYAIYFYLFTLS